MTYNEKQLSKLLVLRIDLNVALLCISTICQTDHNIFGKFNAYSQVIYVCLHLTKFASQYLCFLALQFIIFVELMI